MDELVSTDGGTIFALLLIVRIFLGDRGEDVVDAVAVRGRFTAELRLPKALVVDGETVGVGVTDIGRRPILQTGQVEVVFLDLQDW